MWLLTSDGAELKYYARPPKRYAILSHVWRKSGRPGQASLEQSFQDVRRIIKRSKRTGEDPRTLLSTKIRRCCAWAAEHGFDLVWIDTCCIDKTSSAELSEAINSMFTWYRMASICYAYLHDVSIRDDPFEADSSFRRSKCFTRGWTLQELIAPRDVIFLSREWFPLTSKRASPGILHELTGIDTDVLLGRRALNDVSAAKRMSWAAGRKTSRIEDEAYCLMGLFGVSMPTIYGEGPEAFFRLQVEIRNKTQDQSLFVWGPSLSLMETVAGCPSKVFPAMDDFSFVYSSGLLARSPAAFAGSPEVAALDVEDWAARHNIETQLPRFNMTSYGMRATLPIARFPNRCDVALIPCDLGGATVGLLLRFQGLGSPWCLSNCVVRWPFSESTNSTQRTEYDNCVHYDDLGRRLSRCLHTTMVRYVLVPPAEDLEYKVPIAWQTLYLAYRIEHILGHPPRLELSRWTNGLLGSASKPSLSMLRAVTARTCYTMLTPPWVVKRLQSHGFAMVPNRAKVVPVTKLRAGDNLVLAWANRNTGKRFELRLQAVRTENEDGTIDDSVTRVSYTLRFHAPGQQRSGNDASKLPGKVEDPDDVVVETSPQFVDGLESGRGTIFEPEGIDMMLELTFTRIGDQRDVGVPPDCLVYHVDIKLHDARAS